jgi:hypothetical protein
MRKADKVVPASATNQKLFYTHPELRPQFVDW